MKEMEPKNTTETKGEIKGWLETIFFLNWFLPSGGQLFQMRLRNNKKHKSIVTRWSWMSPTTFLLDGWVGGEQWFTCKPSMSACAHPLLLTLKFTKICSFIHLYWYSVRKEIFSFVFSSCHIQFDNSSQWHKGSPQRSSQYGTALLKRERAGESVHFVPHLWMFSFTPVPRHKEQEPRRTLLCANFGIIQFSLLLKSRG